MKRIGRIVGACMTLCWCAGAGRAAAAEKPVIVGWMQAAGEIRIYPRREDLGTLYSGKCMSGILPSRREAPRSWKNSRVAVYGTLISWASVAEQRARGITMGLDNYCGGDQVIMITRMVRVQ